MSPTTLADQLIEVLLEARVERIYGVGGDSLNPMVDAVHRGDGIQRVHVRNEEAGAFAAAAEAQLTGRLAVCAGSSGPGNTHLIQGLYDAHRTGAMIKLEIMVDGLPDYQTDNGRFDYAAIAQAIGIRSIRLEQPVDVRDGLGEALGNPGPVLVDLVTDSNALSIPPHITAAQARNIPRPTIAR